MEELFRKFATYISGEAGKARTFVFALLLILTWALTGSFFDYSNTWQLVVNTGTTIITFLMVFLIQNTQNRDSRAIHLKLDELLKGVKGARDSFVDIQEVSDEELDQLQNEFRKLHEKYAKTLEQRKSKKSTK